jgi:hypothetical protein
LTEVLDIDRPALVRQVLGGCLGYLYPAALRVAVRLRIADLLAGGGRTPVELAAEASVDADRLLRVLRFLATRGVFAEDEGGRFQLTPAAELLRTDSPVRLAPIVELFTSDMYWRSAGRLEDTVCAGRTAFAEIFGSPFFDHVIADREAGAVFETGLADLSTLEHGPIAASYEFPRTGTVVDVAGGLGGMLHAILSRNPGLRGILFDREPVLRNARLGDPAIAGRWEAVAGDFRVAVPAGADMYLLKRILHDKSDEECLEVLRTCRRAMSAQARLLVVDPVIPPGNTPHPNVLSDVLMMAVWDGRERTEDEFRHLLTSAGLRLEKVIPTPTALSIVEAVPV